MQRLHANARQYLDDSVSSVSGDGELIKTFPGHVYQVTVDTFEVALWLASEDLLVCAKNGNLVIIINIKHGDDKVAAQRLK